MEFFLAQLINGISLGSIYALLVTGFTLLLLVGGVFHWAYAHIVVMSMYFSWEAMRLTGGGPTAVGGSIPIGVLVAIVSGIALTLGTEPLLRPLAKRGAVVGTFILSMGISIIFTDSWQRLFHHGIAIGWPSEFTGGLIYASGMVTLSLGKAATIAGSIAAVVIFLYILYHTQMGRGFRAIGQDPAVARVLGIPTARMSIYSYLIAGLLAGISAVFIPMSLGAASSVLGDILALKVLAVALFAGLGNLRGGLIAAIILGLAEGFAIGRVPGDWVNAIAFIMIMVTVMVKPEGLFGLRA